MPGNVSSTRQLSTLVAPLLVTLISAWWPVAQVLVARTAQVRDETAGAELLLRLVAPAQERLDELLKTVWLNPGAASARINRQRKVLYNRDIRIRSPYKIIV